MKDTQRIGRKYEVQKRGRITRHVPTPEERREAFQQQREAWNELRDMWQATTQELEEERNKATVQSDTVEKDYPAWFMISVGLAVIILILLAFLGFAYVLVLIASLV